MLMQLILVDQCRETSGLVWFSLGKVVDQELSQLGHVSLDQGGGWGRREVNIYGHPCSVVLLFTHHQTS